MGYQRRKNYSRRGRRYIRTGRGGRTKQLVDGHTDRYIRAGVNAIPYLVKSVGLMKSLINTEPKFVDNLATVTTLGTTMLYVRITNPAQGTTDQTRIGNKILLKDVLVRFNMRMNTTPSFITYRVLLFVDKEFDAVITTSPFPLQTGNTQAPLNMDLSKRYVIIKDWFFTLSNINQNSVVKKVYKLLNFHCEFDGATANDTDAKQNQLLLGFISSDNTNLSTMSYYTRVKYYDS